MKLKQRALAVGTAATLAKAGAALGALPGGGATAFAACNSAADARVVLGDPMTESGNSTVFGHVSLWYSPNCRTVAAEFESLPGQPACRTDGIGCGKAHVSLPSTAITATCASPVGSHGCKTGFVNDAGIVQNAWGNFTDSRVANAYGFTGYW